MGHRYMASRVKMAKTLSVVKETFPIKESKRINDQRNVLEDAAGYSWKNGQEATPRFPFTRAL